MDLFVGVKDINLIDLSVYQWGTQKCKPRHSHGPAIRDHFLIHYISDGEGIFQANGKEYVIKKDQGFLICPDQISYYEADSVNPWHYAWIGFNGAKAKSYLNIAGLSIDNPIFTSNDGYIRKCFKEMFMTANMGPGKEIRLTGLLYLFLSQLVELHGLKVYDKSLNRKELYVDKAIEFIHRNYPNNITVSQISNSIGLDRSYLGSIFKEKTGMSPKEYLINYRIDRACRLMKNEELTIGDIARSVGYKDPMLFSKIFKKIKNTTPSHFRKIQSAKVISGCGGIT